jgi:DNA-binding LacI/PurR family transcriptional regulator
MQNLLSAKPDAVFCAADLMAVGAMRAARAAALNIPEDVAFIGFDDLPMAAYSNPPLTTVRQPIYQFGFSAVEILLDLIENDVHPARRVILDTELVIRSSCGTTLRKEVKM